MVVLMAVGIGVVVFATWVFVFRDGYAGGGDVPDTVEHAHLRRVAEARVSALCPGAIRLAEKERERDGAGAEDLVDGREFWRRFALASASVEEDPVAALRGLRGLPDLLEEAHREVGLEAGAPGIAPGKEDGR